MRFDNRKVGKLVNRIYRCAICDMEYMLNVEPYSIPNAMIDGEFYCKKCRQFQPTAPLSEELRELPPKYIQESIDELFAREQ